MIPRAFLTGTILALASLPGLARADCVGQTGPCRIDGGMYHVELPDGAAGQSPALIFLHGWGASGEGMLRARGMVNAALTRGYAVVTPSGMERQNGNGRSWSFHPLRAAQRDEIAFLKAVRDDAAARFSLDVDRMLLAGFSIGGSMVAYLACADPGAFPAYAPVGGNFWHPLPDGCEGPAPMLHTHGWRDGTVPLEGRVLRGGSLSDPNAFAQGNVFQALTIWRDTNGCPNLQARAFPETEGYLRRVWTGCTAPLEFALFDGGHGIPPGWTDMALDWFEGLARTDG